MKFKVQQGYIPVRRRFYDICYQMVLLTREHVQNKTFQRERVRKSDEGPVSCVPACHSAPSGPVWCSWTPEPFEEAAGSVHWGTETVTAPVFILTLKLTGINKCLRNLGDIVQVRGCGPGVRNMDGLVSPPHAGIRSYLNLRRR